MPAFNVLTRYLVFLLSMCVKMISPFAVVFPTANPNFLVQLVCNAPQPIATVCAYAAAAITSLVYYQHVAVCPYSTAESSPETFTAQLKVGRWIFLTRQCLALQMCHCVASLAAMTFYPALRVPTHSVAVLTGGLGIFVTVQYFILVVPDALFQKTARVRCPAILRDTLYEGTGCCDHKVCSPLPHFWQPLVASSRGVDEKTALVFVLT
jgi:hypothetical protein